MLNLKNFHKSQAFTLIEIMIVISIISLLGIILYPSIIGYFERAHDSRKKVEIQKIAFAINNYNIDHGRYRVIGYGDRGRWDGWVNYTSEQYPNSIIEWLEKWWYIRWIQIIPIKHRKDGSNPKNTCNKNYIRWVDLYLFITDETRYTLSTYLQQTYTEQDFENIQNLFGPEHICHWAWHNYAIWN